MAIFGDFCMTRGRTSRRVDVRMRCVESLLGQLSLMGHTLSEAMLVDGDPRLVEVRDGVEVLRSKLMELHGDYSRGGS